MGGFFSIFSDGGSRKGAAASTRSPRSPTPAFAKVPLADGKVLTPAGEGRLRRRLAAVGGGDDASYTKLAMSLKCAELDLRICAKIIGADQVSYQQILDYVNNSQCHPNCKITVKSIYEVLRNKEKRFNGKVGAPFRMMLWHGTKTDTVLGILQNGFVRPVPAGQMYGNGIYFADRSSKSAQYCHANKGADGFLFLCDVELGEKMFKAKNPHSEYTQPPAGFSSVKGTGKQIPTYNGGKDNVIYNGGSIMPAGKTKENTRFKTYSLEFNEYIVYDPKIINIVFLVQVQFM